MQCQSLDSDVLSSKKKTHLQINAALRGHDGRSLCASHSKVLDYIVLSLKNRQQSKNMRNVQNLEDALFDLWNSMLNVLGIIPVIKPSMKKNLSKWETRQQGCPKNYWELDCTTKSNALKNKRAHDEGKVQPFRLNNGLSLNALLRWFYTDVIALTPCRRRWWKAELPSRGVFKVDSQNTLSFVTSRLTGCTLQEYILWLKKTTKVAVQHLNLGLVNIRKCSGHFFHQSQELEEFYILVSVYY